MGNDCKEIINKTKQKMNPNYNGNTYTYIYPYPYDTGAISFMNQNISQNNLNGIENEKTPKGNVNTLQNVKSTSEHKPLNVGHTNEKQNLSGQKTTNNNMTTINSINNNKSAIIESNKGKNNNEINRNIFKFSKKKLFFCSYSGTSCNKFVEHII
jgi:hypothetical protein